MARSRTAKAVILASGQAATALVSLLLAAILSRVFDKTEYATYHQTLLAYNLAAPLLALGLPTALYYFIPGEPHRARAAVVENLLLLGLAGLVFSLFFLAGGNVFLAQRFSNPELARTLQLFAVYPVLSLPASATTACLMARDKVSWAAIHTVATRLIKLVVVLGAVWLISPTPQWAIVGTVVAAVFTFCSGVILMLLSVRGTQGAIGWPGMRTQIAYSIPMGLGAMIATLHRGLDKLIVSFFTVPENFAIYVNGAMEIPFIGIITGSATAVLLPEMRKLMMESKRGKALTIWKRAGIKAGVVIIPLMGLLFAAAPDLMVLLYSEKYRESSLIFRIYLLCLPIRIVIFGAVFQAAGRTDLILTRSVIALGANLLLSISFAALFGYKLIALATVAAIYLAAVPYSVWKVSQILEASYRSIFPWIPVLKLLGITCVATGVAYLVLFWCPWDISFVRLIAAGTAYAVAILAMIQMTGLIKFDLSKGLRLRDRARWCFEGS